MIKKGQVAAVLGPGIPKLPGRVDGVFRARARAEAVPVFIGGQVGGWRPCHSPMQAHQTADQGDLLARRLGEESFSFEDSEPPLNRRLSP